MFNLLVESTRQSRRRTPKYFLLTFLAYGAVMAAAVVGSIMFYKPALADTYDMIAMIAPLPPPPAGGGNPAPKNQKQPVEKYVSDSVPLKNDHTVIPTNLPPDIRVFTESETGPATEGSGGGTGPGVTGGVIGIPNSTNLGPAPEPIKPAPTQDKKTDFA
jgi:hypothetical protein